jgi:SAM-dependent methyltransferase
LESFLLPAIVVLLVAAVLVALGWWLLIQTAGVYLGARIVRLLYDKSARDYDAIKEFDDEADDRHLGQPLSERLAGNDEAVVLDVGTGTARLPLSLFRHLDFKGRVIGLDASSDMLEAAQAKTVVFSESLDLVRSDARVLPVRTGACDAVTCIEALEFLPDMRQALREMVRVLRPGGTLVVTNRCGFDRWTFPGRGFAADDFERLLQSLGVNQIRTERWLTYYDLVWASRSDER